MNEIEQSRVTEICQLHAEIGGYLRMTLEKAIRIGELLSEQKADTKHGEWLPWIENHLPFSERTARDYIRFYERREELKSANVADLTGARKLLEEPRQLEAEPEEGRAVIESTRQHIRTLPTDPIERLQILNAENNRLAENRNKIFLNMLTRGIEMSRILLTIELREKNERKLNKVMAELELLSNIEPDTDEERATWQKKAEMACSEMSRIMFIFGCLGRVNIFPELSKFKVMADPPNKITSEEMERFVKQFGLPDSILADKSGLEKAIDETYEEKLQEHRHHIEAAPKWLIEATQLNSP